MQAAIFGNTPTTERKENKMMKIGSEAPIGSNAKMGAKAWGTVTEESGTVLFDGVVELEEAGEGMLAGFPEGALIPTAGDEYDVTINGTIVSSTAQASDDGGIIEYIDGDTVIQYGYRRGEVTFMCSSNYGAVGENTLRVELSEER